MPERICFVGLDVHARQTAAAAVQLGSGEVFKAQIPGPPVEAIDWMQTLPGPVRAVYEAGPDRIWAGSRCPRGGDRDDGVRARRDPSPAR